MIIWNKITSNWRIQYFVYFSINNNLSILINRICKFWSLLHVFRMILELNTSINNIRSYLYKIFNNCCVHISPGSRGATEVLLRFDPHQPIRQGSAGSIDPGRCFQGLSSAIYHAWKRIASVSHDLFAIERRLCHDCISKRTIIVGIHEYSIKNLINAIFINKQSW